MEELRSLFGLSTSSIATRASHIVERSLIMSIVRSGRSVARDCWISWFGMKVASVKVPMGVYAAIVRSRSSPIDLTGSPRS